MSNKKQSGSFYTPKEIAEFLVDYVFEKSRSVNSISLLEPSAGDGSFIGTIYEHADSGKLSSVVAIEKNKRELNKITKRITQKNLSAIHSDFLDYQAPKNKKFSIVIGNPPYIKKNLLTPKQIKQCAEIHSSAQLSKDSTNNIWTSFLIKCIQLTNESGILAFVLPAEFLQVKFAGELRNLVTKEFDRVEIFTFEKLLFPDCKGQDTVLLVCERKSEDKGIFYSTISNVENLVQRNFILTQNISIKESKWIHHHIDSDDIALLEKLKSTLLTIGDYCTSKPGVVTAANNYFIVNEEIVKKFHLRRFVKPIIQKGLFVNGSVVFYKKDFDKLVKESKPTFLLELNEQSNFNEKHKVNDYISIGEERNLTSRYKMTIRDKWYEIPNVVAPADGLFFKRCNEYPKLLKNSANILVTDSAYVVSMKEKHKMESLIFSFYNSLTLAFAELYGRFYGGGVLELIPSEFKRLPIPYVNITDKEFTVYNKAFRNKSSIKEVCKTNDIKILRSIIPDIDDDTILKVSGILEKLQSHRLGI